MPWHVQAQRLVLALAIGAVGGYLFKWLTLPLPWMLGSMSFVTIATLTGLKTRIPPHFRSIMITVLGIMLGSAFTPAIIARMGEWALTISGLALWMLLAGGSGLIYFRKVAGYDRITAFFSATPGGLNEMVIVGGAMGGDDRTISLTHASRIMLVVFTIPLWYRLSGAVPAVSPATGIGLLELPWTDVVALAACAVVGALGARALRIPAAFLVGPMVLSAIVHVSGLTTSKPPDPLVAFAQVAIGAAIGGRFTGMAPGNMAKIAGHAIVSAIVMLALTVAFSLALARATGYPLPAIVLAFAPGGLAEMSLIALALSVDAAFVASHHIARIVMVVTLAPAVFRLSHRKT
ncbi:MAG TPA: AbrB family transcriptional regulator [Alphaproteobacteria bacterium]|nr:AbrB family transcriptional regulator [Alphaproteobacteria bacterium]